MFAQGSEAQKRGASRTLVNVLEKLLRLAHPIIPFITEEIWQKVKGFAGVSGDTIMLQPYPQCEPSQIDEQAEQQINWLKEIIIAVRNIRAECNIAPSKELELLLRNLPSAEKTVLENNRTLLQAMAKLERIEVLEAGSEAPFSVTKLVGGTELLIPMAGFIDKATELARLTKELEKLNGEIARIENKLSNEAFVVKAPEQVIAKEREKMQGYQEAIAKVQTQYQVIEAL